MMMMMDDDNHFPGQKPAEQKATNNRSPSRETPGKTWGKFAENFEENFGEFHHPAIFPNMNINRFVSSASTLSNQMPNDIFNKIGRHRAEGDENGKLFL